MSWLEKIEVWMRQSWSTADILSLRLYDYTAWCQTNPISNPGLAKSWFLFDRGKRRLSYFWALFPIDHARSVTWTKVYSVSQTMILLIQEIRFTSDGFTVWYALNITLCKFVTADLMTLFLKHLKTDLYQYVVFILKASPNSPQKRYYMTYTIEWATEMLKEQMLSMFLHSVSAPPELSCEFETVRKCASSFLDTVFEEYSNPGGPDYSSVCRYE